jgi:spore coat polysaccharide biosynthesis protein SpsF
LKYEDKTEGHFAEETMAVVMVIQARMSSSRLPGKVLKCVIGRPLLAYQLERLQRVKNVDKIIIATTRNRPDDPIVDFCKKHDLDCYRGDEEDVLSRYYEVAKFHSAQAIVRITADCPLIDPDVVEEVVAYYLSEHPKYDYVSNILNRSYPRGMDTEIFSVEALEKAFHEASSKFEREHVTPYMYQEKDRFCVADVLAVENNSHYRWTVDTQADFQFVREIIETLYPSCKTFSMNDVLELLKKRPELSEINAHVPQKEI